MFTIFPVLTSTYTVFDGWVILEIGTIHTAMVVWLTTIVPCIGSEALYPGLALIAMLLAWADEIKKVLVALLDELLELFETTGVWLTGVGVAGGV